MPEQQNGLRAKLRELLQTQRQLLAQFLLITQEQAQIITGEDAEALLQSLEQRQQVISQVDELLRELNPLWREYAAGGGHEPALDDLHAQIGRILQEITEIDEKNQLAVRQGMDALRAEMRRISETRQGVTAYIKGAEIFSAEFVDERQ